MFILVIFCLINLLFHQEVYARSYIYIVGSSVIHSCITAISEEFSKIHRVRTPIAESTGSGSGFKLFCAGLGDNFPDIVTSSRMMSKSEEDLCNKNAIGEIVKIKIGYDAIVLATPKGSEVYDFSKKDLFMALSSYIPENDYSIKPNDNYLWSSVKSELPKKNIELYGPLRSSGTYDLIIDRIFMDLCLSMKAFRKSFSDIDDLQKACRILREDGKFIEVGYEEGIVLRKMKTNPNLFALMSYGFFDRNSSSIQVHSINGVLPSYESIRNSEYILSRPLYIYVKKGNLDHINDLKFFIKEMTNDITIGDKGYLIGYGFVPLKSEEIKEMQLLISSLLE